MRRRRMNFITIQFVFTHRAPACAIIRNDVSREFILTDDKAKAQEKLKLFIGLRDFIAAEYAKFCDAELEPLRAYSQGRFSSANQGVRTALTGNGRSAGRHQTSETDSAQHPL